MIWKGAGTVKLVITNREYNVPSQTLIDQVQTIIDPTQNRGEGLGLAPIDHEVTVEGVSGTNIDIESRLSFAPGWTLERCLPYIKESLDNYYKELNSTWRDEENLIVRIAQIESRILSLPGVVDIKNTIINETDVNVTLEENAVAVRVELIFEEFQQQ